MGVDDWADAFGAADPALPHNEARDDVWLALVAILLDKVDPDDVPVDLLRRSLARPQMDRLAARFDTEVTAIALVRDELVLAAAAGRTRLAVAPTRVGQRLPFMPPLGSCFAAWGDDAVRAMWVGGLSDLVDQDTREAVRDVPGLVRRRGYSIALGHGDGARLETLSTRFHEGDAQVSKATLREAIAQSVAGYSPASYGAGPAELRSLSAPVFAPDGRVAFTLTLWGPPVAIDGRAPLDAAIA